MIFESDFADIPVEFSIFSSFSHNKFIADNYFHVNKSNRRSCELVFRVSEKGLRFPSLLSSWILPKMPRFITSTFILFNAPCNISRVYLVVFDGRKPNSTHNSLKSQVFHKCVGNNTNEQNLWPDTETVKTIVWSR